MPMNTITKLKYGNTNTFFVRGERGGGLLIDTDYAGTLSAFYKEIKRQDIRVGDIAYILATHYHPDHIGLVSELMKLGVKLLLVDTQSDLVHFSDGIFERAGFKYTPIDENKAVVITCGESKEFLRGLEIDGEIISTPSHSRDSVSLILDGGVCVVGDLEPMEYAEAYEDNAPLKEDWRRIMSFAPKRILYAHANEKDLTFSQHADGEN